MILSLISYVTPFPDEKTLSPCTHEDKKALSYKFSIPCHFGSKQIGCISCDSGKIYRIRFVSCFLYINDRRLVGYRNCRRPTFTSAAPRPAPAARRRHGDPSHNRTFFIRLHYVSAIRTLGLKTKCWPASVAAACEKGRIVSESCHGYFGRLGQVAGKNIIEDWAKHRTLGYPR
ncbi:hypothetical protein EVAR_75292_1 [Eumeta japonica]|uniref:Uncharacterized protein n=1 Tax=Eumeta variegata TaxID=151549 RepID=A0A4C1YXF3_EUMVA|nr:hypothetical protein EVAR_75292_1 [Eumeta japonica]